MRKIHLHTKHQGLFYQFFIWGAYKKPVSPLIFGWWKWIIWPLCWLQDRVGTHWIYRIQWLNTDNSFSYHFHCRCTRYTKVHISLLCLSIWNSPKTVAGSQPKTSSLWPLALRSFSSSSCGFLNFCHPRYNLIIISFISQKACAVWYFIYKYFEFWWTKYKRHPTYE